MQITLVGLCFRPLLFSRRMLNVIRNLLFLPGAEAVAGQNEDSSKYSHGYKTIQNTVRSKYNHKQQLYKLEFLQALNIQVGVSGAVIIIINILYIDSTNIQTCGRLILSLQWSILLLQSLTFEDQFYTSTPIRSIKLSARRKVLNPWSSHEQ